MAQNTGKTSEKIWEDYHRRLGKRAFFFRFVDASEIRGRTGKVATSARSQPSDYILTIDGRTEYAEVKSTGSATSFSFSMIRPSQNAAAKQIITAGGEYVIYIHALKRNQWFRVPYNVIQAADGKSLKWEQLQPLEWKI